MLPFRANVEKAAAALLSKQEVKKNNTLFEEDTVLELGISLTEDTTLPRIPRVKLLGVAHSVFPSDCEVCLLTRPPQRRFKDISKGVAQIKKVIDTKKLQQKYGEIKQRAALCKSFHLFLVDRSVRGVIPKLLGSQFLRKKFPVPIRMKDHCTTEALQKDIDRYLSCTPVLFRDTTRLLTIKIGRSSQTASQIAENAAKVLEEFLKLRYFPHGWDHIKSVYVKTAQSPSLIVYAQRVAVPIHLPTSTRRAKNQGSRKGSKKPKQAGKGQGSKAQKDDKASKKKKGKKPKTQKEAKQ